MLMSGRLRRLLLAGTCLCVCGTPAHLPDAGAAVGRPGPHGRPEGTDQVTQMEENGASVGGGSGPSEAGGEAWSQKPVLSADADGRQEDIAVISRPALSPTGGRKLLNAARDGFVLASASEPPQLSITAGEVKGQGEEVRTKPDPETSSPSTTGPPNPGAAIQKLASPGSIPPTAFVSPQTSTHVSIWGHDETMASLPDPLLPEIGPNLMLREDGPESLWTEAARPSGVDTPVPPSQDEATEGTMSSEALPLIFEPFEDVTSEAAAVTLVPGDAQPPASMATGGATPQSEVDLDRLVGGEPNGDGGGPSHAPSSLLVPDWTSPWQTSGGELLEPIGSSGPSVPQPQAGGEDNAERGAARTPGLEERSPATGPSPSPSSSSFFRRAMTTVTTATHRPAAHKSRSGLEEMESEEDPDEDEENSEESVEDDSEEDQTETPKTSSTRPPYSLIPPPSVWVQRNQGLMRSWVELIREKAGYVSGMLAPVGIGITGALLIVGVLYSVRVIHRKRRNSFKHQRRKVRQPEFVLAPQQPREPGTSRQDQAMLLADSSEDEF